MWETWVEVDLGDGVECRVLVGGTPQTPLADLQHRAQHILRDRLRNRDCCGDRTAPHAERAR